MELSAKIFVAGHQGMVGSAIFRKLESKGYKNIIGLTQSELDLTNQAATLSFFKSELPVYVFLAAAKVGGIQANNTQRAEFIYQNLMIQANVIHAAWKSGVSKLLFLGSSCIYPKFAPQPISEDHLLTGLLEPTNEPYAIAKIAGVKLCASYHDQYGCRFLSLMPTNLYGPNDNFDLNTSHVLPAMIRKFHEAKMDNHKAVVLWGSGTPMREFLHVDDLADAAVFVMQHDMKHLLYNVGYGKDIAIRELAQKIQAITGHKGDIIWDGSKPDGTPRKLLNSERINNEGWFPQIGLREGIASTYKWYLSKK